jgi:hypothetical protein
MVITDDIEFPRLTPHDDRYPSPDNLLRSPSDLTAEQFDLLAAAWADDALSDESLAEVESLFASDPAKKVYAESYRQLILKPGDERYKGLNRLLRPAVLVKTLRRTLIVTIASAAAVTLIFILKPAAVKQTSITAPFILPQVTVSAVNTEPSSHVIMNATQEVAIVRSQAVITEKTTDHDVSVARQIVKTTPLAMSPGAGTPVLFAGLNSSELRSMHFSNISTTFDRPENENWIIRGVGRISKALTKEKEPAYGYIIASACIKSLNNLLGWNMELDKAVNDRGDLTAVSFNSSLLSFTSPVKKSSP